MPTPLEKARQNPNSMKAKILTSARKLFGEYGFHGTTIRMIAADVGIDISTLHYHWGEKVDLYEAVLRDMNEGLHTKLIAVEKMIKDRSLAERIEIAINEMADYLFKFPEFANLTIFQYFTKTRSDMGIESRIPDFLADIACSMGLADDRENVPPDAKMKVLAMTNAILSFVSGTTLFTTMLDIDRKTYVRHVKETLKFYHVPPYK